MGGKTCAVKPIEMDNKHGKSCGFIGLFINLKPPTPNDMEYEGRSINGMDCVSLMFLSLNMRLVFQETVCHFLLM